MPAFASAPQISRFNARRVLRNLLVITVVDDFRFILVLLHVHTLVKGYTRIGSLKFPAVEPILPARTCALIGVRAEGSAFQKSPTTFLENPFVTLMCHDNLPR